MERGAPEAVWRVGHARVRSYLWENHPVLARGPEEFPIGWYVAPAARRHLRGTRADLQPAGLPPTAAPDADHLTVLARSLIAKLGGSEATAAAPPEPLVEAERIRDGRPDWELSVSDEVAFEHSDLVDELADALAREAGVTDVHREDREVLVVRAARWSRADLETWAGDFLRERLAGVGRSPPA